MLPAAASQVRYHYRPKCEAAVNSRTALELDASFQCRARARSRHHHQDVALQHFSHFFLLRSQEHSKTAKSLMFLQNQWGGCISFRDIRMPETQERERGLQATQDALHLEKSVSQSLLNLHHLATESSNAHLCHFLETRHLDQQLEFIKGLGDHLTNVHKMGAPEGGLAEYIFDKLTLGTCDKD
ncbi:ferritin heavy chain-like [Oryx dammah]|uniref:ferritin heavy chain-like n=1 Tax=Oryx dammah TaxID=59534 RepID=UPI001A9B45CB|nr:ferritin heavy chain-like [Oryx dammah]